MKRVWISWLLGAMCVCGLAAAEGTTSQDYHVHPDDVLQVTVYEEPDLSTRGRVTASGDISLPLLGSIRVGGLTIKQAEEQITALLQANYLVNPQVTVFLESTQQIFITGAVNKPGAYPFSNEHALTAMEAVAMAGGFSEEASLNRTRIIRKEAGKEQTIRVKAKAVMQGDKNHDVALRPGDIVYVPESLF